MKKRKGTAVTASAVSLSMLSGMAFPVSAAQEIKVAEETENSITYHFNFDMDYLTISADDYCYFWQQEDTAYYAVTLEQGTIAPEDWSVTKPELCEGNLYRGENILPWKNGVFDYSELDENTIVLTDVTDAAGLYQTEGVIDVYSMDSVVTNTVSLLDGTDFVVYAKPDTTLTLEDFASIPEVTALSGTSPCYTVKVDTGVEQSAFDTTEEYVSAKAEAHFRLTKDLLEIESVNSAILSFAMDLDRPVTTTYTLTRIADPDAYGDIDSDGEVNPDDAYRALVYYAEQSVGKENAKLTGADGDKFDEAAAFCAADVNGDGVVNGDDAYGILCYYAAASVGKTPKWDSIFEYSQK